MSSVAVHPKASARSQKDLREKLRLPLAISPRCWRLIPLSKDSCFLVKEDAPNILAKSSISAFWMTSMSYRIFQFYEYAQKIVQTIVSIFFDFFGELPPYSKITKQKKAPHNGRPELCSISRLSLHGYNLPSPKGQTSKAVHFGIKLGSKALASIPKPNVTKF